MSSSTGMNIFLETFFKFLLFYVLEDFGKICNFLKQFLLVFAREPIWANRYKDQMALLILCILMSCSTLYESMDHSPSGSSVHGIIQARILEWVAISFSRGYSQPMDQTCVSCIGRQILYYWATYKAGFIDNWFDFFNHYRPIKICYCFLCQFP